MQPFLLKKKKQQGCSTQISLIHQEQRVSFYCVHFILVVLLRESTALRKDNDCKAGYMCKIRPSRIEEVSQPGICHRPSSVGWPAWNIIENTDQDRKKRDHFLPSLPVAESELQWLSGLQVCAALNLYLPESTRFCHFSPSCPICAASQLASNAERNKHQGHTDTCTGCALFLCWEDVPLDSIGKP